MGLVEFHVDSIDVQTIPKFVLFGGNEAAERDESTGGETVEPDRNCPVSPGKIIAVSIGATLFAFALARLKGLIDEKLALHC